MTKDTKSVGEKRYTAMLTLRNCFQTEELSGLVGWNPVISAMMCAESDEELVACTEIVTDFFIDEGLDITRAYCRKEAVEFAELIAQSIAHHLDLDIAA